MEKAQVIFGTRAVMEAIRAGRDLEKIIIQSGLSNDLIRELIHEAKQHGVSYTFTPPQRLARFTNKNHQGVIAFLAAVHFESIGNIVHKLFSEGTDPFILVLDRITDVRNFGAIVRTAESAGVHAILIADKGNAPVSADAVKTSAGALHYVPICRAVNLKTALRELKESGLRIVACTEKTSDDVYGVAMEGPLAIVLGSEEDGIHPDLLREADALASIPMHGKIASLNVSVAAGVILYEAVRQRRASKA